MRGLKVTSQEFNYDILNPNFGVYVGMDLSLTNSAVSILENGKGICFLYQPNTRGGERLYQLTSAIFNDIVSFSRERTQIFMESYSFNSKGDLTGLAELAGCIKQRAYCTHLDINLVAPNTLKKFVIGQGKGTKDVMMLNLYKRFNIECNNNNISDAISLSLFGYFYATRNTHGLVKGQIESLQNFEKNLNK